MDFVLPLESDYTVIKRLGSGAYGVVYLVQNREGHKYALKTFKEGVSEDDIMIEVECLDKLKDICGDDIYCFEEAIYIERNGIKQLAIIMEYLEGYTELFRYITPKTTMRELEEIRDKTIRGFIKIGEKGIAHNDPNSTNILVKKLPDNSVSVKVIDLGKCSIDIDNDIESTMRSLLMTFALILYDILDYDTEFKPFFAPFYEILPMYGIKHTDIDDMLTQKNIEILF